VTEIWVAAGTYRPDLGTAQTPGDRLATFQLVNGVAIYGGFPPGGGDGTFAARDVAANETILSGDLAANDTPLACINNSPDCDSNGNLCVDGFCIIYQSNSENSYHVVTGSGTNATAVIDGCTITAGNADASDPNFHGGGIFNNSGNPTVAECSVVGNKALRGGGMYNVSSSPTLTRCSFARNAAASAGGGLYNFLNSSPSATSCTIKDNSAVSHGGGIVNSNGGIPAFTNCIIKGNWAGSLGGGGIYNANSSTLMLTSCTLHANWSNWHGGGVHALRAYPKNSPDA
jgi:hypothetical protein